MDITKVLLVYMMLTVGAAAQGTAMPDQLPTPAPAPTESAWTEPAPTAVPYQPLAVGDRGEEVRQLQEKLAELGYLNGTIDGVYGQQTKRAVTAFQENNDLTPDGSAGAKTLALLYEAEQTEKSAVPPAVAPLGGVTVPVYYVGPDEALLRRVDAVCRGNTVIFANDGYAGEGFSLASDPAVAVSVSGGKASPAAVTFSYRRQSADRATIPVSYRTESGAILAETVLRPEKAGTMLVEADLSLLPAGYRLISAGTVQADIAENGAVRPGKVVFTCQSEAEAWQPPEGTAAIRVEYVNESGYLLDAAVIPAAWGETVQVSAEAGRMGQNNRLLSQTPVTVTVSETGEADPVTFLCAYQPVNPDPTAVPTPTPEPTATPTAAPTEAPTAEPTAAPEPLREAGASVSINGSAAAIPWYRDASGRTMVCLRLLCEHAGWEYEANAAFDVRGRTVLALWDDAGVQTLTADDQSYRENALVWQGELYVDAQFLSALGLETEAADGLLSVSFPQG